ncbi:4-hydroxy-tetrahydrodipicolinate reductase [Raineya orbicola]|jgi:4-hydroxy-tetrahydrodipicolinate reductase|uniref:4-hydroxy-tetrahydrodipicolinate reductase n=1 Tax=Raineya orbicola TaxID=2016530 RepID=A0A2N3IJ80_9BACT|nr:4-hydroxy-tetrahydrodipicolinate reductase [Raineya orbicola]PKQ70367.1 dapB: dihydrodipicolinate reductase [Raineya orbicola]
MRIALIGYGKMGKEIEKIALERSHSISFRINKENANEILQISPENTDVAIEFTSPESAFENLKNLLTQRVSVVCGTTGWLAKQKEIENLALQNQVAFLYASNFSLGVNLFFRLNELLAQMMNKYPNYKLLLEEIHHTEKKDAPSGTSITLAQGIMENYPAKTAWVNEFSEKDNLVSIVSKREPNVPGTHIIRYQNEIDCIEIRHEAYSRKGFALGAVLAAEFITGKKGIFSMKDVLQLG